MTDFAVVISLGPGLEAMGERWDPLVNLGRGEHICVKHGALHPAPVYVVQLGELTPAEERMYQELQRRRQGDV